MTTPAPPPGLPPLQLRRRRELLDQVSAKQAARRTLDATALQAMTAMGQANGGAFSRAQALAQGIHEPTIRRLLRTREWVRVGHGVYADRATTQLGKYDPLQDLRLRLGVVNVAAHGLAAGTHITAARLQGIPLPTSAGYPLHILRPAGLDHRAFALAQIHTHDVHEIDLAIVQGLTVTSPARAALEVACVLPRGWGVAALDHVLNRKLSDAVGLARAFDRLPAQPGRSGAAAALAQADGRADSPLESHSRVRFDDADLPKAHLQVAVYDEDGLIGYADFLWDGVVVGEADGLLKYQTREDLIAEKLREDRLRAQGLTVVRWTWAEIMNDPDRVIARVQRALTQASRRAAG